MADSSPLADQLDRAGKAFALARDLVETGNNDDQSGQSKQVEKTFRPTDLDCYVALRDELEQLHEAIRKPPEGFAAVAQSLRDLEGMLQDFEGLATRPDNASEEDRVRNSRQLVSTCEGGIEALKEVAATRAHRSEHESLTVDPLTFLERYPDTPRGHISFLELVSDEVRYAAEAKRKQLELGYSNSTIERMVRGIKWREAGHRLSTLKALAEQQVEQVATVLRRDLTSGNLDQIEELFIPAVNALCDELSNQLFDQGCENPEISVETDPVRSRVDEADADYLPHSPELRDPDQPQPDTWDEVICGKSYTPLGAVEIDQDPPSRNNALSMKGKIFDLDIALRASGDTPERIREWPAIRHQLRKWFGHNLSDIELWERCMDWLKFEVFLDIEELLDCSLTDLLKSLAGSSHPRSEETQRDLSCADGNQRTVGDLDLAGCKGTNSTASTSQQADNDEEGLTPDPWLGDVELAIELGVDHSRLKAFRTCLGRARRQSKLQDSDIKKLEEVTRGEPRYLYLRSSPRIVNIAKEYKKPADKTKGAEELP